MRRRFPRTALFPSIQSCALRARMCSVLTVIQGRCWPVRRMNRMRHCLGWAITCVSFASPLLTGPPPSPATHIMFAPQHGPAPSGMTAACWWVLTCRGDPGPTGPLLTRLAKVYVGRDAEHPDSLRPGTSCGTRSTESAAWALWVGVNGRSPSDMDLDGSRGVVRPFW